MPMQTVHVLLVEDNAVDVEAVRRAFARHQIANPITVARDGRQALDLLRSRAVARPYLILLDLNLPRMNGIELLRQIRADPVVADSVVFVLTTSRSDKDLSESYRLHVAGYMVKGDVGRGLQDLTRMLDAYWRVVELPTDHW